MDETQYQSASCTNNCPASTTTPIPGSNAPPTYCGGVDPGNSEYFEDLGPEPPVPNACITAMPELVQGKVRMPLNVDAFAAQTGKTIAEALQAAQSIGYDTQFVTRNQNYNNAFGCDRNAGAHLDGFHKSEFISMRFKTKAQDSGTFEIYSGQQTGSAVNVSGIFFFTISECPGDFGNIVTAAGMKKRELHYYENAATRSLNAPNPVSVNPNTLYRDKCIGLYSNQGLVFNWKTKDVPGGAGSACVLEPNKNYYLNVVFREVETLRPVCRSIDITRKLNGLSVNTGNNNCSFKYGFDKVMN